MRDADEIERSIAAFAQGSNGALIVTASTSAIIHRELITTLAARYRLPAVYTLPLMANAGGLISYGPYATFERASTDAFVQRLRASDAGTNSRQ